MHYRPTCSRPLKKKGGKWTCKNCGELGHSANGTLKRELARGLPRSGLELDVMVHEQFSRRMIE
jgi:hypothetical protein